MRDKKSTYVHTDAQAERADKKLKYRGLQVDIFPLEQDLSPRLHHLCMLYQKYLIYFPQRNIHHMGVLEWTVPVSYWLLHHIVKPLFRKLSKHVSGKGYLMTSYGIQFPQKRPAESIYPLQQISFEGLRLPAPRDVDTYLTALYGDWRRIPDANEIKTHNVNILIEE